METFTMNITTSLYFYAELLDGKLLVVSKLNFPIDSTPVSPIIGWVQINLYYSDLDSRPVGLFTLRAAQVRAAGASAGHQ